MINRNLNRKEMAVYFSGLSLGTLFGVVIGIIGYGTYLIFPSIVVWFYIEWKCRDRNEKEDD